jgi:hypothetical protein
VGDAAHQIQNCATPGISEVSYVQSQHAPALKDLTQQRIQRRPEWALLLLWAAYLLSGQPLLESGEATLSSAAVNFSSKSCVVPAGGLR